MKFRKLRRAIRNSLRLKNLPITLLGGATAYILLVIFSFPTYMYQLLGRSILYLPEVIAMSTYSILDTAGLIGLSLTIIYAALTGITLTNFYLNLKNQSSDLKNLGAFLPGFLVSGCASCGVGLLPFIGFTGVLVSLPFSGNSIRVAGILLMLGLLQRSGDPETCSVT